MNFASANVAFGPSNCPACRMPEIRQEPAHKLYDNKHDKSVYRQQNELIEEVYNAVRDLRMMFSKHPKAKVVEIPDELKDEGNIVIY